ncbi:MAG: energy-coupling factor ABC transporter ATP-binding protein, partial [Candidatus Heimdallarchaeaceae archaeon]
KLSAETVKEARKRIGFVFQNPDSQVFSASVFEDVAFGPRNMGLPEEEVIERVEKALTSVDLLEEIHSSPFKLSFGQRKRVAIAGVLAMDPAIIALDEPFANLDYPSRKSIQDLLEKDVLEKGKTLIFTTHSRKLIEEWADDVLFLEKGKKVYSGKPSGLKDLPDTLDLLGPL